MGSNEKAELHLAAAIRSAKALGCTRSDINNLIARNVLHQEIGMYGDDADLARYHFSDAQRDRLIAHARQDAASAMIHADTCLNLLQKMEKRLNSLYLLVTLLVVGIAIYIYRRNS